MTAKSDSVLRHIQDVEKFVANRVFQDQFYIGVSQELEELISSLKGEKLTLHIVSQDLTQVQALQNLLEVHGELQDAYKIKASKLPEISDRHASRPPALVLQPTSSVQVIRYELETAQAQIIGRNPAVAKLLLPDILNLTSGNHAELQLSSEGSWQIRDSGSRNGTFVNGSQQKLQGSHKLKEGDLICLGSPSQAAGSATLVYEIPSSIHPACEEAQKLLDCQVLCLVVSPQSISETTQKFIQLAKKSAIAKLFIVVDQLREVTSFQDIPRQIENSLKDQLQDRDFEFVSLLLKPFAPTSGATVITPHAQPEFEQFCETLSAIAKDQTVLTQWGNALLKQIVEQIEAVLVKHTDDFKEELQQGEQRFKELSERNLKKTAEKVYKKVDGDRDAFFRQIKTELSQSRAGLLDEFRQSSLPYKIQQFTKQLRAETSKQGGFCYVRLKLESTKAASRDVHASATELCNTELTRWASAEWSRIRHEYANGGLDSFFKRSYDTLNFVPDLTLEKDGFSTIQTLSIQSVLEVSNVEPTVEMRFKQAGFWSYMFKNLKGQIITIVGTITLLGSGLTNQLGGNAKEILIPALIPITLAIVWLSYNQEKETKIEEVAEKLQKETASYYQSYVKGLVDRVVQRIGGLLESEEKCFRETLETVKEAHVTYITELDRTQNQLKVQLDEMKRSGQTKLEKDLIELRKIKQSL